MALIPKLPFKIDKYVLLGTLTGIVLFPILLWCFYYAQDWVEVFLINKGIIECDPVCAANANSNAYELSFFVSAFACGYIGSIHTTNWELYRGTVSAFIFLLVTPLFIMALQQFNTYPTFVYNFRIIYAPFLILFGFAGSYIRRRARIKKESHIK